MTLRLTKMAKRAGCAAKQPSGYLMPLLGRLPPVTDPNVLVGSNTADDAAIYRLSDDTALVLTGNTQAEDAEVRIRATGIIPTYICVSAVVE